LKNPSAPFSFISSPEEEEKKKMFEAFPGLVSGRNPENVLTCHCQMTSRLPFYHPPLFLSFFLFFWVGCCVVLFGGLGA
jgi:hypothetical protein